MTPLLIALVALAGTHLHRPPLPPTPVGERPGEGAALPPPVAATSIKSEVMLIVGSNDGSGIDPRLAKMPVLIRPPFSAYNSYRLLSRTSKPLTRGQASLQPLPTGRELRLTFKEALSPQKPGGAPRYLLSASIETPNGKSFLPLVEVNAKAGEWFWLAGQQYQGGTLFVGIRAVP